MAMNIVSTIRRKFTRASWRSLAARPVADGQGTTARASVPGRDRAAESTVYSSHTGAPRTATILAFSLLAAALLCGYYARVYSHAHAPVKAPLPGTAVPPDSPLPPLPPIATRSANARPDTHRYVIGNILDPNDELAQSDVSAEVVKDDPTLASYSDAAPATGSAAAQRPQARRLDGTVFARTTITSDLASAVTRDAGGPMISGREVNAASSNADAATGETSVAHLLRSDITPTVAAAVLPTQRLLLPKGAFLDCTLETAIDSTLPGLTTCVTAFDTLSADGTVVLLERGTKLVGEVRSQVQQGTARVFVLWTEARTPKGIVVALASPGTDALGRSGIPGTVDRHFLDRFGAAILVSMINGAIQGAVNRSQQSGGTVILNPSGAGDVATEVLRSTLSIPPTVRIPQGERIQVLVARDLDFRSVYTLHAR